LNRVVNRWSSRSRVPFSRQIKWSREIKLLTKEAAYLPWSNNGIIANNDQMRLGALHFRLRGFAHAPLLMHARSMLQGSCALLRKFLVCAKTKRTYRTHPLCPLSLPLPSPATTVAATRRATRFENSRRFHFTGPWE
jgi:hypothetical protein